MSMKLKIILVVWMVSNLASCKDEFLLDNYAFDDVMVVDGAITNQQGPYSIRISKATMVNNNGKNPYEDCIVTIFDNEGNYEVCNETKPGIYESLNNSIQGEVGNSYYLKIETPNGRIYQTEPQQMLEPVEIDTVYAELTYKYLGDYSDGTTSGYQFYTSTKLASKADCYLLWNLEETYQYSTDYDLYAIDVKGVFKYVGQDTSDIFQDLKWCWKTEPVGFLSVAETGSLDKPQIKNHPLHFVGTNSRKLTKRYCLFLKQYSITKEAYLYWKNIEDQISSDNFLILSQPFDIKGNVKNIKDPTETVYGYFTVASVSNKRVFFNKPEASFGYDKCVVIVPIPPAQPLSDYYVKTEDGTVGSVEKRCLDCRNHGGDIVKPEFWIDY